ncbi:MAG TPA: hypothetical protein VNN76_09835 [Bacteroidota bacterium]|nr:hypothetical protein [Bacteroidota bacterium]
MPKQSKVISIAYKGRGRGKFRVAPSHAKVYRGKLASWRITPTSESKNIVLLFPEKGIFKTHYHNLAYKKSRRVLGNAPKGRYSYFIYHKPSKTFARGSHPEMEVL